MANIKDYIKNGEMEYDKEFRKDTFLFFKSEEDANIYVLNTATMRAMSYNAEAQNPKRIGAVEFNCKLAEMQIRAGKKGIEDEEIKEKGKKLARKPYKSKDVAHRSETCNVTLTAKQADFVKHLPDTCFWENGLDSCIWIDCLCDEIGGQFANKPMTVGAMISTLCEKGLGVRSSSVVNGRKCKAFALTDKGKVVAQELGLG